MAIRRGKTSYYFLTEIVKGPMFVKLKTEHIYYTHTTTTTTTKKKRKRKKEKNEKKKRKKRRITEVSRSSEPREKSKRAVNIYFLLQK